MEKERKELTKQEARTPEGIERTKAGRTFIPETDIYETQENIVIIADMPGVDEKSVHVTLEQNVLTIEGSSCDEPPKGQELVWSEYEPGDYHRSFTLGEEINRDNIQAVAKNGVLRLTLPKVPAMKMKKITIQTG